jgi:GGDEF domain-containing protein
MALQGPFVVLADTPAPDVVGALRAAGGFPVVETDWADAGAALHSVLPEAVVIAEPCSDRKNAGAYADAIADRVFTAPGPFTPIIARLRDDSTVSIRNALAISASTPAARIPRRLGTALRVRTLHRTVLRRVETLTSRGLVIPELPDADPLGEATVLVTGRGRTYPALSLAVGERVGLVGALCVESAARALTFRDIDGMVIADGFSSRVVEALLTVLAEEVRFRDLPVVVIGGHHSVVQEFLDLLPNLDHLAAGPGRLVELFLPFVRVHAFGARLRRMLKSLDAHGMIDPDTGLLAQGAFWRDLDRAVNDAEKRGVRLSVARFSFDHSDGRVSLDAARLLGRLMRRVDFACREADNSIFAVFTETDLRAAHVIARRIASVLKRTMLTMDRKRSGFETAVTLATLKPTDNVESLIARVMNGVAAG